MVACFLLFEACFVRPLLSVANRPTLILGVPALVVYLFAVRRDWPLVPVNCAAIPAALFESELFGPSRGAFTGSGPPGGYRRALHRHHQQDPALGPAPIRASRALRLGAG